MLRADMLCLCWSFLVFLNKGYDRNYIEQQKKVSGTIKTTSLPDAKARHEEIAKQVHQVTTVSINFTPLLL